MDNRYLDVVVGEMKPFLDEQGFKSAGEGIFTNDKKQVSIEYDEQRQLYRLLSADIGEDGTGEVAELTSWLFDDSQTKNDAVSVGIDFTDTLRKDMGIKAVRKNRFGEIELPTNDKNGAVGIGGLTQKLLAVYPDFKEVYKESVARNGKFLYLEFYRENFIPRMKEALCDINPQKKQLKKLMDVLSDCYISGDRETGTLIIAAVTAACDGSETALKNAFDAMGEGSYLVPLVRNFVPELKNNQKLRTALLTENGSL